MHRRIPAERLHGLQWLQTISQTSSPLSYVSKWLHKGRTHMATFCVCMPLTLCETAPLASSKTSPKLALLLHVYLSHLSLSAGFIFGPSLPSISCLPPSPSPGKTKTPSLCLMHMAWQHTPFSKLSLLSLALCIHAFLAHGMHGHALLLAAPLLHEKAYASHTCIHTNFPLWET